MDNKKFLEIRDKVFDGDRGLEMKYHRQMLESTFMLLVCQAEAMQSHDSTMYNLYLEKINGYDPHLKSNLISSIEKLKEIKTCLEYPPETLTDIDEFYTRLTATHPDWIDPEV